MTGTATSTLSIPIDGVRCLPGITAQRPARWRWVMLLLAMLIPVLAACRGKVESIPVGIVGYNHTDSNIYQFLVNGGAGGGNDAHRGGGTTVCCAMVPSHWQSGMKVEISWTTDLKVYHEKVVPIPEYDEVGDLAVHFLRGGDIKVFVTNIRLGHPDYPLTGPEAGLNPGEDPVREDLRQAKKGTTQ